MGIIINFMISLQNNKKSIIKLVTVGLFSLSFVFLSVQPVFAGKPTLKDASGYTQTVAQGAGVGDKTDIKVVISSVIKTGLSIVGLLFFILIFYGGFNWMAARGNEQQIEKSKNTVIAAFIGLAIVLGAYAITALVGTFMGK